MNKQAAYHEQNQTCYLKFTMRRLRIHTSSYQRIRNHQRFRRITRKAVFHTVQKEKGKIGRNSKCNLYNPLPLLSCYNVKNKIPAHKKSDSRSKWQVFSGFRRWTKWWKWMSPFYFEAVRQNYPSQDITDYLGGEKGWFFASSFSEFCPKSFFLQKTFEEF